MAKQAHSGFTLVEMMVVLVTLVILAAAVVPVMRGSGRQADLDDVAVRVAASARFARETAISRAVTVDLMIETAPAAVTLTVEPEDSTQGPTVSSSPMGSSMRANTGTDATGPLPSRYAHVALPQGVTAQLEADAEGTVGGPLAAGEALRFPPDGRTDGGVIVLQDARGRERLIFVKAGTGQVVGSER